MKEAAKPLLMVPFREVRHDLPDDVLHYEPVKVRGQLHQWTIPAHRHQGLHQFQLLVQGGVQATLDGERFDWKAPVALMVAPGVVHGFDYQRDSAGHQVTLPSATLRALLAHNPALLARLERPITVLAQHMTDGVDACESLFLRLGDEFAQVRPGRAEALQSHAMLLSLWFLRHQDAARAAQRGQALRDTLVQRYRTLLEKDFRRHPPLGFYATALGVTTDHLSRVCRASTGTSALDMAHERVVLEARRLLAYTPAPVVDIARDLGFDDPAYFSRFFAKLTGQAPSTYRSAVAQGMGVPPA